jgi:tRNA threonylcarbamoyladenosine biosynthesis protein TsaB
VIVLAIDTATPRVSCALRGPDGPLGSLSVTAGRRHGETLAPAIDALTRLTGVGLDQVDLVAVDVGPGLFTGLRVGVASAKAIASARALPMVPVSSLDALAFPHRPTGRPVAAVVDARRGEVFYRLYLADGTPAGEAQVLAPPDVAPGDDVLLVGDGARRYAELFRAYDVAGPDHAYPTAEVVARLAVEEGRPVAATGVVPEYLRHADVRIGWEQRQPAGAPSG